MCDSRKDDVALVAERELVSEANDVVSALLLDQESPLLNFSFSPHRFPLPYCFTKGEGRTDCTVDFLCVTRYDTFSGFQLIVLLSRRVFTRAIVIIFAMTYALANYQFSIVHRRGGMI